MKITKKILAVAVAVAAFGLTSCIGDFGNTGDKIIKGLLSNSHCEYTYAEADEDTKDANYARHISSTRTNRKNFTVKLTLEDASDNPGVIGAAWYQSDNDDGTRNFIVCGIHHNPSNEFYISYFRNISMDDMGKSNFGASVKTDLTTFLNATTPVEYHISTTANDGYESLSSAAAWDSSTGTLETVLSVQAQNDGSYKVYFFAPNEEDNYPADGTGAVITKNISNSVTLASTKEELDQKLGWYAMVKKDKTLYGKWKGIDISGEPIAE
ncbi:MAG: hypothetical protein K6E97_00495 [Treponema sp.]|nr:hypothetical protein [Treponema sp.]